MSFSSRSVIALVCAVVIVSALDARRQRSDFYDFTFTYPADWKARGGAAASSNVFALGRDRVAIEYQLATPTKPHDALADFLRYRAELGLEHNRVRGWKVAGKRSGTTSAGATYHDLFLQFTGKRAIFVMGIVVLAPGGRPGAVFLGTGLAADEYETRYMKQVVAKHASNLNKFFPILFSVADSVRWKNVRTERNSAFETWLKQKRTFRYHTEGFQSSGDVSMAFSNRVSWNFGADGGVQYARKHFSSFNDNSFDLYGRPDLSSGYRNGWGQRKAFFEVHTVGRVHYLAVKYPSGLSTLHLIQQRPFAIDGLRDGCCR